MSLDQIDGTDSNVEALAFAQCDAAIAQRIVALWAWPAIPDQHVPEALNIPPTLWNQLKTDGDTPPLFVLGRRVFVRTVDLRSWIDRKALAGAAGSKLRREAIIAARELAEALPVKRNRRTEPAAGA
jgi:hypothetical protein